MEILHEDNVKTEYLCEDSRSQLLSQSKRNPNYSTGKFKTRYERRIKSRLSSSVAKYNKMDMNKLFKDGILDVEVDVQGETNNYTVKISFGKFLDNLQKQIENQKGEFNLRAVSRALLNSFNSDDVYIHCSCPDFCLHPTTKIKLLSGEVVSVEELKNKFDTGEKLQLYSVDDKGDFKPGLVENVWITNRTDDFIKITLDNNEEILTTPNHLYMLRDGSYKRADELVVNESLMSFSSTLKIKSIEYIKLENEIPVYDIQVKDYHNFLVNAGVILHNCYRFNYWATKNNLNSGEAELRPSDKTNPNNDKGVGCKHVMLVLSNTTWLLRVSSVITNYVNYMQQHKESLYQKFIYPAIYGKEWEEPEQLSFEDELTSDQTALDISNKYAKTKNQFKPGNKIGNRFISNKSDDQITLDNNSEES